MSVRLTHIALAVTVTWLAGSTAAHAFSFQDAPQGGQGQYAVPQFNLEEQAKQFRAGSGKDGDKWSTPLGGGSLQFGVKQQGQTSPALGFSPTPGYRTNNSHFERMLTPENFR